MQETDMNVICSYKFSSYQSAMETFAGLQRQYFVKSRFMHFQKEYSPFNLKNRWKCRQNPGSCLFRSSVDYQNDPETVELESNYLSLNFDQWIKDEKNLFENDSKKSFAGTKGHQKVKTPFLFGIDQNLSF